MVENGAVEHQVPDRPWKVALAVVVVTAVVTAASYLAPEQYAATAVGLSFLAATWVLVLRKDGDTVRAHGLALGGLLVPDEIDLRALLRDLAVALAWALACFAVVAVPFWIGFSRWFRISHPFDPWAAMPSADHALGQLLVIALPEEAFFRGWLQTKLDAFFPRTVRVLGLPIGPSIILASAVFALGHFLTIPSPARFAVFFPSLLFGALRKRTGGIGAGVLLHALFNLLSSSLARGYGLPHA
jgi:hypothetical protein